MKKVVTLFGVLTVSLSAFAGKLLIPFFTNPPEQVISQAVVKGENLLITTRTSSLEIPMINASEATLAAEYINAGGFDVKCNPAKEKNVCESLVIDRQLFRAERAKLFPEYYKAIEDKCRSSKSRQDFRMYWGAAKYAKSYTMNPYLALAMGGPSTYGGEFVVEIFDSNGRPFKSYNLDEREVVYLNNTNPINLNTWMEIDSARNMVVLIANDSCKAVGEVPYR